MPVPALLGNGKAEVQLVFTDSLPFLPLLALALVKPFATAACLGSGAPGGLFTPSITMGAALAATLAHAAAPLLVLDPGTCALLGAGAFLAATTAGPLSAAFLLLELTGQLNGLVAPLALAIAGAVLTTTRFETRSIYSCRIQPAKAKALDHPGPTLSTADHLPQILAALLTTPTLPVLDEHGDTIGHLDPSTVLARQPDLSPLTIATARDFTGL